MTAYPLKPGGDFVLSHVMENIVELSRRSNELLLENNEILRKFDSQRSIYLSIIELLMESNPKYRLHLKSSLEDVKSSVRDFVESAIKSLDAYADELSTTGKNFEQLENILKQASQQSTCTSTAVFKEKVNVQRK